MAPGKFLTLVSVGLSLALVGAPRIGSAATAIQSYDEVEEAIRVFNRGKLLHQEQQYQEAIREYQAALKLDNQNPFVYNALGLAFAAVGNLPEALKAFNQALQLNPDLTDIYNNMGMVYAEQAAKEADAEAARRAKERAFEAFSRAVRNPNYTTPEKALYNMGNLYLEDGNLELALMHFKRAVEKQPKFALGYRGLGKVYMQMKEVDEAQAQFEKALELASEDVESIFLLARIHQDRGELDEARTLYRRVVEVDRFSNFGRMALASLEKLKES